MNQSEKLNNPRKYINLNNLKSIDQDQTNSKDYKCTLVVRMISKLVNNEKVISKHVYDVKSTSLICIKVLCVC